MMDQEVFNKCMRLDVKDEFDDIPTKHFSEDLENSTTVSGYELNDDLEFHPPKDDEVEVDDQIAVIDTELTADDEDDAKQNDYVGKYIVVCPICAHALFSDHSHGEVHCPVCDVDVEIEEAAGKVVLPDAECDDIKDSESTEEEVTDELEFDDEGQEFSTDDSEDTTDKDESLDPKLEESAKKDDIEGLMWNFIDEVEDDRNNLTKDGKELDYRKLYFKSDSFDKMLQSLLKSSQGHTIKDRYRWNDGKIGKFFSKIFKERQSQWRGSRRESMDSIITESDLPAPESIEDCQKWIDYDMEHYKHITKNTEDIIDKAGFQIIKDDHGDYEVAAKHYESMDDNDESDKDDKDDKKLDENVNVNICPEGSVTVTSDETDATIAIAPKAEPEQVNAEVTTTVDVNDNAEYADENGEGVTVDSSDDYEIDDIEEFDTESFDSQVNDIVNDIYDDDEVVYESRNVRSTKQDSIVIEGIIKSKKYTHKLEFVCEDIKSKKLEFKVNGLNDLEGSILGESVYSSDTKSMKVESLKYNFKSSTDNKEYKNI